MIISAFRTRSNFLNSRIKIVVLTVFITKFYLSGSSKNKIGVVLVAPSDGMAYLLSCCLSAEGEKGARRKKCGQNALVKSSYKHIHNRNPTS